MSCYHPLLAVNLGKKLNGKARMEFLKTGLSAYEVIESYKKLHGVNSFPLTIKGETFLVRASQLVPLPCGQCIGCKLDKSREWAARCMLEMKYHKSAYFLTLTYSNDYLVYAGMYNDSVPAATLVKRDVQLFMKRLRKRFSNQRIRFYLSGEYGSTTLRPHYHLILFGLELPEDDLTFWKMSKGKVGNTYSKIYTSACISELWPYGLNAIGDVTFESVAYVARYTTKKLDKELLYDSGVEKEFSLMSRKPGIGYQYYLEHSGEIYDFDEIFVEKGGKPFKVRPSKYYDRLFDIDEPETMEVVKSNRKKAAEHFLEVESKKTDKNLTDYINTKEANKLASFEKLRRVL